MQQKGRLLIGLNCILLCLNNSSQIARKANFRRKRITVKVPMLAGRLLAEYSIRSNVNKFIVLGHTSSESNNCALKNHLKQTCWYELYVDQTQNLEPQNIPVNLNKSPTAVGRLSFV